MAKMIFVLVFAIAVAMPSRTVMGQGNWQDLMGQGMGQGDLAETIDEAKKALGAANTAADGQAAFDDYFGAGGDAGYDTGDDAGGAGDAGASLAGLIDENTTHTGPPPLPVDSPIGAPEDLPADTPEGSQTDDYDSFAPGRSPFSAPIPKVIPGSPDDEGIVDKRIVGVSPIESPTDAPDGAPSDDDTDMDTPDGAPSFPPGVSGFDDDDN